ncbi:hypothetical protein [Legionella jordanis]|uniref:Uridine/cytidine kinase n=1 Tax=Legionella jordanis TaxID=456 RepID=A0A0W0VCQ7_9GAMM|nr:hypothetical protein [Legionella jordanis]KTD17915.1 uridine/cytidine kinase [Legionella jordanis]RMX02386.1 hypothetical protein EAW55_09050 [Legionella jordanis]RMX21772.1 hypothetical protein EAS68_03175 [Legionella jordanis]VEH13994.1 uridine/cytidine kinase [Legionella jordanis]
MFVVAICGPLESNVKQFALELRKRISLPVTMIYEQDSPESHAEILADLARAEGLVLLVGHRLFLNDRLEHLSGHEFKIKIFFETDPETCLINLMKRKKDDDATATIKLYETILKPLNEQINASRKMAHIIIPKSDDYSASFDLLCSSLNDKKYLGLEFGVSKEPRFF